MISKLEEILGYHFKKQNLLIEAITHPSFNMHSTQNSEKEFNYERLEFLGDSVLSLVITEKLIKQYPNSDEGDLAKKRTHLVKGESLARVANKLDINDFIIMSDLEEKSGGKENASTLENVIEAIIGAMYIDGGLAECSKFINREWQKLFEEVVITPIESKTFVQEWAQDKHLPCPEYTVISRDGSDHHPIFTSKIFIEGYPSFTGKGPTKKASEKAAAKTFIKNIISDSSK